MSVDTAADRLPWLADEPVSRPITARRKNPLSWTMAVVAVVAAGALWMGARDANRSAASLGHRAQSSTTVHLPPAAVTQTTQLPIPPQPEVRPVLSPQLRLSPSAQLRIPMPSLPSAAEHRSNKPHKRPLAVPATTTSSPAPAVRPIQRSVVPAPWNPRVVTGASGRVVQVGAFGSIHQAKRGWWFMVHDYPAMARLPAVVRLTRNSKGRAFYRFDVGTTSQAHSEVLCQRMIKVSLSCAVVGLPWKAKVER